MRALRTVIVDDNATFLDSISSYLARRNSVEVVSMVRSAREALEAVKGSRPDLVLVDLVMPNTNGLVLTRQLKALADPPRVIILTLAEHPAYAEHAKQAGADGLLSKYEVTTRLMPMIMDVCEATIRDEAG